MSQAIKWRAGLVGAGYICEYHIAALRRLGDVEIVGVCDVDAARAAATGEKFNIPAFGSLNDLRNAGADVIHVLTPPHTHAQVALEAIASGCHVLVEKPLATDANDCRRIESAAREAGLSVCVNHSLLFDPQVRKALDKARSGKLGKIVSVDILRSSIYPPFGPGPLPPQYRTAGYPFRDLGVHALYLLEAFLGPIENVQAEWQSLGGDPNLAFDEWRAQVRCAKGMGQIQLSWNVKPLQSQIIIQGTRGVLRVDLFLMFHALRSATPLPKAAERIVNAMTDSMGPMIDVPRGVFGFLTKRVLPYHGLQDLVAAFYSSLRTGHESPVPVASATRVVEWTEKVGRAADQDFQCRAGELTLSDSVNFLVTGASGALGGAIVEQLVRRGTKVRAMVRRLPADRLPEVEYILGDLGDSRAVDKAVNGAAIVIHAGAAMKGGWPDHERATVHGTQNIIDACLKYRAQKLVHISSMSVLNWADGKKDSYLDEATALEPRSDARGHYTRAKLDAERRVTAAFKTDGLRAVILRPGQIFGGRLPLMTGAVARKMGRRWLVLGSGKCRLPLIHIDDVVSGVICAADSDLKDGQIIQLVDESQPSQNDVLRQVLGENATILRLPRWLVFSLGAFSEIALGLLKRPSPLSRYRLKSALSRHKFRSLNAGMLHGWRPRVDVWMAMRAVGEKQTKPLETSVSLPEKQETAAVPERELQATA